MSGVLIFEIFLILLTIGVWYFMKRKGYKHIIPKLLILLIGVLLFETMSEPMWRNHLLHGWTYLYHDVSWIITLGWTNIFMVTMLAIDHFFKEKKESIKFWLYLALLTIITTPIEVILLNTGIRSYDAVLTSTMTGINIPLTSAPIEIIMIVPIIGALVIPFYKVWVKKFNLE